MSWEDIPLSSFFYTEKVRDSIAILNKRYFILPWKSHECIDTQFVKKMISLVSNVKGLFTVQGLQDNSNSIYQ